MLAHAYNIIIDCVVRSPGHGSEFVDGLNANKKQFLSMLMKNMQNNGAAAYDTQVEMHTSTVNT